jgi:palmitoyltransferase
MDCWYVITLFFAALLVTLWVVTLLRSHCFYVLENRSKLEPITTQVFRNGDDRNEFNLGKYKNFQEVFGNNKMAWFLPIFTSLGDGSSFAVRAEHQIN